MRINKKIKDRIYFNYGVDIPLRIINLFLALCFLLVVLIISLLINGSFLVQKRAAPKLPSEEILQKYGIRIQKK